MIPNLKYGTGNVSWEDTPQYDGIMKSQSITKRDATQDEEKPLLSRHDPPEPRVKALTGVGTIIAVLLLGTTTTSTITS